MGTVTMVPLGHCEKDILTDFSISYCERVNLMTNLTEDKESYTALHCTALYNTVLFFY